MSTQIVIYWLAATIIVIEALNKLERTCPLQRGLTLRQRVTETLKAAAWLALAAGGAFTFANPHTPTWSELCLALGFATLIIRTRVKEG